MSYADKIFKEMCTDIINEGFSSAYFVWWNQDISWYNLRVQDDWVSVYDSGRISVYQIV